jgi:hypothetical protein
MTYVVVNHTTIGAVMVVIIWWCDLQLHMSCITELQEAVVVVIIWWCDLHITYVVVNDTTI